MKPDSDTPLKFSSLIYRVLASCRRVIFLLLTLLMFGGVAAWFFVPDVNTLKPDIEIFLKQELGLKSLKLGSLSWYWVGHLGVKAASSSFSSSDGSLTVQDCDITVNISTLDLLSGKLTPAGIHLRGGVIRIVSDGGRDESRVPIPERITLSDMRLHWKHAELTGSVDQLSLSFDKSDGSLSVRVPGMRLEAQLDDTRLPVDTEIEYSNLDWLPEQWQQHLRGSTSGRLRLRESAAGSWHLVFSVSSEGEEPVSYMFADTDLSLDSLKGELRFIASGGDKLTQVEVRSLEWKLDQNHASAKGMWRNGVLKLSASASRLAMPVIWQSLRPLGDKEWHAWLAGMQHGVASEVRGELELPWPDPLQAPPSAEDAMAMRYHVNGHVQDADISLGIHEDFITRTVADVELDQQGLKAMIVSTKLPHNVGDAAGVLRIPWETMLLNIDGRGEVDGGRLHRWMDEEGAVTAHWEEAASHAEFSVQWMPDESSPRQAFIKLKPLAPWRLELNNMPLKVESGELAWRFGQGIEFSDVVWSTPHLNIKTDVTAAKNEMDQWQVLSMQSQAEGSLDGLVSYFLLPIESASGQVRMNLDFDGQWQGSIDLKDAAWENLLGTRKESGEAMTLSYTGTYGVKQGRQALMIGDIRCKERLLRLHGSGDVSASGLHLNLEQLETASFSGSVEVHAPFGPDPWELDVKAAYLNRNALPASLSRGSDASGKPWALRAELERFIWDDAEIKRASLRLASAQNSIAVLRADSLQSGELAIGDISAIFSMPGGGVVDLRSFRAKLNGLHLALSATLTPESERGMHWRGFAELEGDFGNMMKRAELSTLFDHGSMHALFSGQGEFLSDQPWWQGLDGRLRLRVDNGRVMKGGTLSKFFAAISIADFPSLFLGRRDDLTKPGLGYKRLQMEAVLHGKNVQMHKLAMRASAMDVAGKGAMNLESSEVDLTLVVRPLQNLDAVLSKVPLIRDVFGGAAHSFIRRVYRMHGPITDAEVDRISPEDAGLAAPGMIEQLLNLPARWFGEKEPVADR